MVTPVDPNTILLTGENSFLRLGEGTGSELTSRASFWRVWLSPVGPGHALFLESELTDGQVQVYADSLALARWLQQEIEPTIHAPNGDLSLPVIEAEFSRSGDTLNFWTEEIVSQNSDVRLTWYDFLEPFVIRPTGKAASSGSLSVYSLFVPARGARLTIDGQQAAGHPRPERVDDHDGSSSSLALSETWLRER